MEVKELIEKLIEAAQHPKYPECDPPVVAEAREYLSKLERKEAYRVLGFADVLKEGDEMTSSVDGPWRVIPDWMVGTEVSRAPARAFRRPCIIYGE